MTSSNRIQLNIRQDGLHHREEENMFKDNTKIVFILVIAAATVAPLIWNPPAAAQEPLLGQIQAFGFNFAPRGWTTCDGQILAINQYTALFALLGTTYGGDGRTTFGLPDLRGRVPIHRGQGLDHRYQLFYGNPVTYLSKIHNI
jgi:hypothetical protein